jgi:hypothetical protein
MLLLTNGKPLIQQVAEKPEDVASSFDKLRMRQSVYDGLNVMVSLLRSARSQ